MLIRNCARALQHGSFALLLCKACAGNLHARWLGDSSMVQHSLQKQVVWLALRLRMVLR
jgi:hypothetical protein